ncbi:hypothetical protein GCM10010372_76030 [Streptomyces tauricus]|nr:hypothetical protein GCM10010372_76030 [Streptomyces tauricus]
MDTTIFCKWLFEFAELGHCGVLRRVEVAACASHAVLALLEEGVAAIAVSEVVVLPGFVSRGGAGGDGVAIDHDLNGAHVALEIAGFGVGTDSSALGGATVARNVHTIIGLAASGVGVGLGPSRMRTVPRPGVRFCEVTPRTFLPDLGPVLRGLQPLPGAARLPRHHPEGLP